MTETKMVRCPAIGADRPEGHTCELPASAHSPIVMDDTRQYCARCRAHYLASDAAAHYPHKFAHDDMVRVADIITGQGNMASYLPYHGEIVRISHYWRNGNYIVRDDATRTTVAISARYLTKV